MMRHKLILGVVIAALVAVPAAFANYAYRDGNGVLQQIFSITCLGTIICPGQIPINTSGSPMVGFAGSPMPSTFASAGSQQNGLAVSGVTSLTVPPGTTCALITVEGASVRRTSDGSTPSASAGTPIYPQTWTDCGPLSSYKFYAVSGSPTIDAEYFK